jgi:hypothetical protein
MDLREIGWGGGGCRVDSPGSGYGSVASCSECGGECSGSGTTELVGWSWVKWRCVNVAT